jgi:hypothetical protein
MEALIGDLCSVNQVLNDVLQCNGLHPDNRHRIKTRRIGQQPAEMYMIIAL